MRRSPVNWPAVRRHAPMVGASGATVFVAATAFLLAYGGSRGAALDAGMTRSAAGWYPLCIEGVIVAASVATVVLPKREPVRGWARLRPAPRFFPWTVLLGFSALSAAANVLHALDQDQPKWWAPIAAAVPPLALPICVRLAERVMLSSRPAPAPGPAVVPPPTLAPALSAAPPPVPQIAVAAEPPRREQVTAYVGPPVPFKRSEKGPCGCADCGGKRVSYDTWRRHHNTAS